MLTTLYFGVLFLNKLEPCAYCLHYSTITKHSNLSLIDRHQFPCLTVSINGTGNVERQGAYEQKKHKLIVGRVKYRCTSRWSPV